MAEPNIVVATFNEESRTYQAFSEIKQAGARRRIKVETLAIVRRAADGSLETPEISSFFARPRSSSANPSASRTSPPVSTTIASTG